MKEEEMWIQCLPQGALDSIMNAKLTGYSHYCFFYCYCVLFGVNKHFKTAFFLMVVIVSTCNGREMPSYFVQCIYRTETLVQYVYNGGAQSMCSCTELCLQVVGLGSTTHYIFTHPLCRALSDSNIARWCAGMDSVTVGSLFACVLNI